MAPTLRDAGAAGQGLGGKGSRIKDEGDSWTSRILNVLARIRDLRQLATPHSARQGLMKAIGPMNDSALERVSSESIESARALGLSGLSP